MTVRHPVQPLVIDKHGVKRFKKNEIVRYLLDYLTDANLVSLNNLHHDHSFDEEDWSQFYQLIGYSLSGYADLNISDELYYKAVGQTENGNKE